MTLVGIISDSACGASHAKMKGSKSDRECTLACLDHGAKLVFVSKDTEKVYAIANQDLKMLRDHAGETVQLTGNVTGDTITVAKVEMSPKK